MARYDQFSYPRPVKLEPGRQAFDLIDAIFDTAVLSNPKVFATVYASRPVPVDPPASGLVASAAVVAYDNSKGDKPVVVYVAGQGTAAGQAFYVTLGLSSDRTTLAQAPVRDYDAAPEASIVVPAGMTAWVNVSSPDSSGDAINVLVTVIPLNGRGGLFK